MSNKYAYIQIFDENEDIVEDLYEPLKIDNINVVLEDYLESLEIGESISITAIEMTDEEYEAISEVNGY